MTDYYEKWKRKIIRLITYEPEIKEIDEDYKSITFIKNKKVHNVEFPATITFNKSFGHTELTYYIKGKKHREDGPAKICYNNKYVRILEEFYNNNSLYRNPPTSPSSIFRYDDGNIKEYIYSTRNGGIHRLDYPAHIIYSKNATILKEEYFNYNRLHRVEEGPAVLEYYENGNIKRESYYKNGKLYRAPSNEELWEPCVIEYGRDGKIERKRYMEKNDFLYIKYYIKYGI